MGRSGIVYPYSTAAYVASIEQGIEVALHNGADTVVLTTGGITEQYAMKMLPELPEPAFVQMGDYVGKALDHCVKMGVPRAIRRVPGSLGMECAPCALRDHDRSLPSVGCFPCR